MARASAVAVVLMVCLGAIPVAGPRGHALAQEAPKIVRSVDGKLEKFDGQFLMLDGKGTYPATSEGARTIAGKLEAGVVKVGGWVRIALDEHGSVADVEAIEAPPAAPEVPVGPRLAELQAEIEKLRPGERFMLDGQEVTFDRFIQGQVWFAIPGIRGVTIRSLKEIKQLKRLESLLSGEPPPSRPPGEGIEIRHGCWYKINGVYGYCLSETENVVVLEVFGTGGGTQEFLRSEMRSVSEEKAPDIFVPGKPTGTAPQPPEADRVKVEVEPLDSQRNLDWTDNSWRVQVTVRHAIPGRLLVGARVEVRFRGQGTMVRPAKEAEILAALGSEGQADEKVFTYEGTRHYLRRDLQGVLIGEIAPEVTDDESEALPFAVFPDVPEKVAVTTRLLAAAIDGAPRVVYDPETQLLPMGDDRAVPYLVKAYSERGEAERAAALKAMARGGNPRLIPFLLWEIYNEQGEAVDRLKRTVAAMRDASEDYLIQILKNRGWESEIAIPNARGTQDRKKAVVQERMLTRVIELLDMLGSERAFVYVLSQTRAADEVVRETARSFFTRRPLLAVPYLVRKLRGETILEARPLLLEIEAREPGTLGRYIRESLALSDQDFENSLVGLPPEEVAEKQIEFIVKHVKSGDARILDIDVDVARDALTRLASEQAQITGLRREVAAAYAAAVVRGNRGGTGEPRRFKAQLLRRALALDPTNETARREFASVFFEIGQELRQGAALRSGAGDDYEVLEILRPGEALDPEPLADGVEPPEAWRHARAADGRVGYVRASVIEQGRSGKLLVVRERRTLDEIRRYLALARAFYPGRLPDVDGALAEVTAEMAGEAAAAGDWRTAHERFRIADSLSPGRYRLKVLSSYLRAAPYLPAFAVVALVVLLGVLVRGIKANPGSARSSPPPREPAATKRVPS